MKMPEGPGRKLVFGVLCALFLAIALFQFLYFPARQQRTLYDAVQSKATAVAEIVAHHITSSYEAEDRKLVDELFTDAAKANDLLWILLRRPDGSLFASHGVTERDLVDLAAVETGKVVTATEAQRGKNSVDWFFGFKLHLVVNDRGQLLACRLTAGNVDDRVPVPQLTQRLWGKLFGDKGYLSQPLTEQLLQRGVHLVTHLKSKMKNRLILLADKLLLRKRSILETIIDQLKNISQIEHTRHRSMANFMVNIVSGLIAYSHQPTKPSLALDLPQLEALIPN